MAEQDLSRLRIDKGNLPARRGKKKRIFLLLLVPVLAVLLYWLHKNQLLTPSVDVDVYNVQAMYPAQTFTRLNASGYVVAQRKSAVAAKITAQLVELSVEEGSRVTKGEVIARLEDRDARAMHQRALANLNLAMANLTQVKAELRDAKLDYERNQQLIERGIIAQSQFDKAEARYKSTLALVSSREAAVKAAQAAVKEAEVAIEYTYIRAPFDAVVLTKNADIGDIVTPVGAAANSKAAVVTLADMTSLQVEVDVSESNIWMVHVGQPCEIQLDALPNQRFAGKVYMIVPTADRTKASVLVKVAFDRLDPRILPEMSAKVAFLERPVTPEEEHPVLAVPRAALTENSGKAYVFLVRDQKAHRTPVKTGRLFGPMQEILEGIEPGDRVILNPPPDLSDLGRVSVPE